MSARHELVLQAVARSKVGRKGWARGNCPFCDMNTGKADKKQSLGLQVSTGRWHCLKCGAGGTIRDVPEDLAALAPSEDASPAPKMAMPEGFEFLAEEPGRSALVFAAARHYLEDRSITARVVREARIGATVRGRHAHRVVVPIYDGAGKELLGWSARDFTKLAERKYLYPEGMRRVLYNSAALAVSTGQPIYVVEGVFDALALWPDAVACLGKPLPEHQDALRTTKRPIVVALDGDAWEEGVDLALHLRIDGVQAAAVRLPPTFDPATVPRAEIESLATKALADAN